MKKKSMQKTPQSVWTQNRGQISEVKISEMFMWNYHCILLGFFFLTVFHLHVALPDRSSAE